MVLAWKFRSLRAMARRLTSRCSERGMDKFVLYWRQQRVADLRR
jgi:hypothetical protein